MNNKGFTLVELISAVAILVLLMVITTIVILNVVRDTNNSLDEGTKKVLYTAAESYLNNTTTLNPNATYNVTVSTLINNDLISRTFIESQDMNFITENSCVVVSITNGVMNYEFSYECN